MKKRTKRDFFTILFLFIFMILFGISSVSKEYINYINKEDEKKDVRS